MIARFVQFVWLVCLLGLAAISGTSTWAALESKSTSRPVAELTGYSHARLAIIEASFVEAGDVSPRNVAEQAALVLQRAPMSEAALAFSGIAALRAGDLKAADRAFQAEFRRNPRNEAARIWRTQQAMNSRELPYAIGLLDGLLKLGAERAPTYLDALAEIALLPGGGKAIGKRLEHSPSWAAPLVDRLNRTLPDLELLLELNRITPGGQREFIARVNREKGLQAAFANWLELLAPEERKFNWPYDREFRGARASPPFNWTVHGDLVEFMRGGGLNLTYLGRGRLTLVEQTMLLAPGSYRFSTRLSGDACDNGGGFSWGIQCVGSSTQLGRLLARPLTPKSGVHEFPFTVPDSSCEAQRLVLSGEPGEFPIRARAELQSVSITPAVEPQR